MTQIPFSRAYIPALTSDYVQQVLNSGQLSGDYKFTKLCHKWLEDNVKTKKALLTTSCTHALEMSAILSELCPGDEVIMPSFTFSSTANAFALRGAKIVFVDIRPDTMNIDENAIAAAITAKTKAIVAVHYGGVACDMDKILEIARAHNLIVIEDAAQAHLASYKGQPLGSLGHFGCLSFHETKNLTCGEGGAILVNDPTYSLRAEIIREKGTNRAQFFRGEIDKYSWLDIGSSFLPSDINAAILWAQLERAQEITNKRLNIWYFYQENLAYLENQSAIELQRVPQHCTHNAHIFFLKTRNLKERSRLIAHLRNLGIYATFHYVPLHSSNAGMKLGVFRGQDRYTTTESERIVRLPLFYGMTTQQMDFIVSSITRFYQPQRFLEQSL